MTEHFPFIPPPELVQQWEEDWHHSKVKHIDLKSYIAAQSAQWGSGQELEACCEWLDGVGDLKQQLRTARRPKPPSLKEQALAKLPEQPENMASHLKLTPGDVATIRRALEQLDA